MKIKMILEAEEDLLKKLEPMYKYLQPPKTARCKDAIEALQAAVKSSIVYNVDFNDFKGTLSRMLEYSLKEAEHLSDWEEVKAVWRKYWDISTYVQLNQTGKQIKTLKQALADKEVPASVHKALNAMLEINEAAAEIKKLLDSIKSKIVKGRKPSDKPVDPNAFHSKMGSKEAQKLVTDAIQKEISHQLDQYEKGVAEYLQSEIDNIKSQKEITVKRDHRDPIMMMILQRCFEFEQESDYKAGTYTYKNLKLNDKGREFAKKEAKEQRDGLELRFLAKNVKKLSHIVDLKGNLDKIETLPRKPVQVKAGSGTLEAGFTFKFADNSEFTVINKIVTKYSYNGKPFEQFPTTFHDVVFPDKTRMKTPSEEKMVKEFGAKKVTESSTAMTDYVAMLNELHMFMTLNTAKIQQYAVNAQATSELAKMQEQFRKPILNGKTIGDLILVSSS